MEKIRFQRLLLDMIKFNSVFKKELIDFIPETNNSELSPLLFRILNEIHNEGTITSSMLSKQLSISIPNTSRSINRLHEFGYINKKQDSNDKRIIYLTLSQKGFDLISKSLATSEEQFFSKLSILPSEDIEELSEAFSSIGKILSKMKTLNNEK
ncbi:MAG: MarR family winged helix-turn-helix transcriptional regulator [Clostridiaceae bacterium]